ncbi:MAG: glycosyltransferase [Saprospiraceae bacterium]|nr:glycosyltransferase [Saprospiraceae bacterium]
MTSHSRQVFSTPTPNRWYKVKWVAYSLISLTLIGFLCWIFTYTNNYKPNLPHNFTKIDGSLSLFAKDTTISWAENAVSPCCQADKPTCFAPLTNSASVPLNEQIRAGFFVNWDPQSYYTLLHNIDKLNMVLPEWLFLSEADTVVFRPNERAFKLFKEHPSVAIVPMLSNFWQDQWHTNNLERIFSDKNKAHIFIESLVHTLKHYGFKGVNIDFEALPPQRIPQFYEFMTDLHNRLNQNGLLVSQSVVPLNRQYDLAKLAPVNDLMFIMAYNQHYQTGKAGSIADQKWVEDIMDTVTKTVPTEKLVLCIASYGLDWGKKGTDAQSVTYRGALSMANEASAKIDFNNTTYNLEFTYTDDDHVPHKVFFVDAATNFNQIRAANNVNWRGVALWRLGAEDPRLWQFYNKDLSTKGLENGSFDVHSLKSTIIGEDVDYVGSGEVIDILTVPTEGAVRFEYDKNYYLISEEHYDKLPSSYVAQKFGKVADKKLVLTFDDGPDDKYTGRVLDILKKEKTPATFFVIGSNIEKHPDLVKRIFNEGHEIGNHTFSHPKLDSIASWRAEWELIKTRRSIEALTSHSTILFRPPYNQYQEPENLSQLSAMLLARKHNYLTVNESIDAQDWKQNSTVDSLIERIERGIAMDYGHIILLHDAGGNREITVEALPQIIKHFRNQGYTFTTIADLIGKPKSTLMPLLQTDQTLLVGINHFINSFANIIGKLLYWVFYLAIGFSIFRSIFILFFAFLQRIKQKKEPYEAFTPPLSIIVPAYNEELNAVSTVMSLLQQNYVDYEIVFVDDGSKDETYQRVKKAFSGHPKVQVLTKPNGGKASALNFGLLKCRYNFVVCIDADTQLDSNALREIAKPFKDPSVGAVAGNVRVGNTLNWLTKWQSIEYTTAQNFDRMAFAYLNCITVVPGAIGAFRRKAIVDERFVNVSENDFGPLCNFKSEKTYVGKYETDTLAEDCDLTIQILKKGYKIAQNNNAIAITESPETIKQFLKQRFRWTFGVLQTFWKNRDALFNTKYKGLGWVALPNMLIFQFILPIFAPIADLILIYSLINWMIADPIAVGDVTIWEEYHAFILYGIFMFFDLLCAGVALRYEKMPLRNIWMVIPQRFVYRALMYSVLYQSYTKALKGEMQSWGILKRTGSMGQIAVNLPQTVSSTESFVPPSVSLPPKPIIHNRPKEVWSS